MTKQPNQAPADAGPGEPPVEAEKPTKIIKRYSNRKLYDTERSKYVTLDEISRMIKQGEEIRIIDNESKEDLTSVTLTQIIYEEEKRESRMPLSMLRNLIQSSGATLQDFFDRSVKTPVAEAQKTVEKSVEELKQSAVHLREAATHRVSELTDSAKRIYFERKAEEFKKSVFGTMDELEGRLKHRLEEVRSGESELNTVPEGGVAENNVEPAQAAQAPNAEEQAEPKPTAPDLMDAHHISEHVALLRERLETARSLLEELERLDKR